MINMISGSDFSSINRVTVKCQRIHVGVAFTMQRIKINSRSYHSIKNQWISLRKMLFCFSDVLNVVWSNDQLIPLHFERRKKSKAMNKQNLTIFLEIDKQITLIMFFFLNQPFEFFVELLCEDFNAIQCLSIFLGIINNILFSVLSNGTKRAQTIDKARASKQMTEKCRARKRAIERDREWIRNFDSEKARR